MKEEIPWKFVNENHHPEKQWRLEHTIAMNCMKKHDKEVRDKQHRKDVQTAKKFFYGFLLILLFIFILP